MNTKHLAMLLLVPLATVALTPANGADESPPPNAASLKVNDHGPLIFIEFQAPVEAIAGASEDKLEGAAALEIAEDIIEKLRKIRPVNTSSRAQCKIISGEAEARPSEDEEGDHRVDVMGMWGMECQKPPLLKYLDIRLFKAMPSVNAIDAYYFSDTAQIFKRLTPASKRLSW
ncbi:MAG: DUF2796 domain-containing protein [Arenicellales bacterium]|nr:DUF2796 domain-containing protein [Arenicellales bacterium]